MTSQGGNRLELPFIVWAAFAAFVIDHVAGFLHERRPELGGSVPVPVRGMLAARGLLGGLWTFMKGYKTWLLLLFIIWLEFLGAYLILMRRSPLAQFIYSNF